MRNLFAVNKTDEDNTAYDGEVFLRQSVPAELAQRMDQQAEQLVKSVINKPLIISIAVTAMVGLGLLRVCASLWSEEVDAPILTAVLLVLGIACLVASGLLAWWDHRRRKLAQESDEFQMLETEMDSAATAARMTLGIPADAADLEVLGCDYVIKRGKEKFTGEGYTHETCSLYAFVEDGELMLADSEDKYAIPLSEITAVRRRQEKVKVWLWMKEDEPKSAAYKPYGIKYDKENDIYTLPEVYAIEISHDGEAYEVLVPAYEWERVLQPLTGLMVTEEG